MQICLSTFESPGTNKENKHTSISCRKHNAKPSRKPKKPKETKERLVKHSKSFGKTETNQKKQSFLTHRGRQLKKLSTPRCVRNLCFFLFFLVFPKDLICFISLSLVSFGFLGFLEEYALLLQQVMLRRSGAAAATHVQNLGYSQEGCVTGPSEPS